MIESKKTPGEKKQAVLDDVARKREQLGKLRDIAELAQAKANVAQLALDNAIKACNAKYPGSIEA